MFEALWASFGLTGGMWMGANLTTEYKNAGDKLSIFLMCSLMGTILGFVMFFGAMFGEIDGTR